MQYSTLIETRSFYIHWPFCPYKCSFCPFVALSGHDQFMEQYHQALIKEINRFSERCKQKPTLDTLYFGGGTPSTYPPELLLDTFGILRKITILPKTAEITLEVNPGTVDMHKLHTWREVGINRLSIGVQSLKDRVLVGLNRKQSAEDVFELMKNVQGLFENVSIDLILGLPGISDIEWKELVQTVVTWPIKHVSMYFLEVHENTPLHFQVKKKQVVLPHEDSLVDLYKWSVDVLLDHGFEQYEVSSFAQPGYRSRHNTVYWDRKPYKAFGLGACSFDGAVRFRNVRNLMRYCALLESGEDVDGSHELLTQDQVYMEKLMLGIRRPEGCDLEQVSQELTDNKKCILQKKIQELKDGGFIGESQGRLMLTEKGLLVENSIATALSL